MVIALIRTSTSRQEIETQKEEVLSMIHEDHVPENDIVIVGTQGASAIKLDEEYLKNIEEVFSLVDKGNISTVYAWAIDRIGRNEEVLMRFKNYMIDHKVQVVIKTPSMRLLNSDGTVNAGMELAFSLFSTMAKQEMEQKKARFKRARNRNKEMGRYNGGNIPTGYTVDENNIFVIDEESAKIVREIFSLMATGKYSCRTLGNELNARGYRVPATNSLFTFTSVRYILINKCYIGESDVIKTPAIVTHELFYKALSVLKSNNINIPKETKHHYFGVKLLKCKECGSNYVRSCDIYCCLKHKIHQGCSNGDAVSLSILDGILWDITRKELVYFVENNDDDDIKNIEEQISVINMKIPVLEKKIADYNNELDKIIDMSVSLPVDKIQRLINNLKVKNENENKELNNLYNERERLHDLLKSNSKFKKLFLSYNSVHDIELKGDEKLMSDLVHRFIVSVTLDKDYNFSYIALKTLSGREYKFKINYRTRKAERYFIFDSNINDYVTYNLNRIIRNGNICTTSENEKFKELDNICKSLYNDDMQEFWYSISQTDIFKECVSVNEKRTLHLLSSFNKSDCKISDFSAFININK